MIKAAHFCLYITLVTSISSFAKTEGIKANDIPKSVIKPCLDETGRIADPGGNWNHSDVGLGGETAPRSRLIRACKAKDRSWRVLCEKGGYAKSYVLISAKYKMANTWESAEVTESPTLPGLLCE